MIDENFVKELEASGRKMRPFIERVEKQIAERNAFYEEKMSRIDEACEKLLAMTGADANAIKANVVAFIDDFAFPRPFNQKGK